MDVFHRLAEAWWGWMGPMLWQASLLIVLVGAIDLLVRRWAWPQVRHALWLLVVIKLVLPPAWSLPSGLVPKLESQLAARVVLPWRAAVEPTVSARALGETADAGLPSSGSAGAATVVAGGASAGASAGRAAPGPVRAGTPWLLAGFAAWLLGALVFVAVLAARLAALRRWHDTERRGLTIPPWYHELLVRSAQRLGVLRLPAIVFSDKLLTPAVCGVWRPVMYLPRDYLDNLAPDEAEHVLLHELAHLKRGDLWAHALDLLLQVVYWFNPLVALARRRLQHTRELCADLAVAETLREGTAGYRLTLLNTARRMLTESAAPGLGLLGVFEEPFRLVSRLRWLEKPTWERRAAARATAAAVALAMIVFVLPMAGGAPSLGSLPGDETGLAAGGEPAAGGGRPAPAELAGAAASTPASGTPGDALYFRNLTRREKIFLDARVSDEILGGGETWLGDGAVTVHEGGRTTIVNLRDSTLTYVNHDDRSYVVTPLPLDLDAALDPEVRAWVRSRATSGSVRQTGRVLRVLDRPCREFEVESWGVGVERGGKPVKFTVLACNDVPADLAAFRVFLTCLRQLHGRVEGYCHDLLQIDGLQMRLVRAENRFPFRIRTVDEVVEMKRRPAPADLFAPPREYERKERIERL